MRNPKNFMLVIGAVFLILALYLTFIIMAKKRIEDDSIKAKIERSIRGF